MGTFSVEKEEGDPTGQWVFTLIQCLSSFGGQIYVFENKMIKQIPSSKINAQFICRISINIKVTSKTHENKTELNPELFVTFYLQDTME